MAFRNTVPVVTKKKAVAGKFDPDTYRVLFDPGLVTSPSSLRQRTAPLGPVSGVKEPHFPMQRRSTFTLSSYRRNNPHPSRVDHLRTNCRSLLEPECQVYTAAIQPDDRHWWPHRTPTESPHRPLYSSDSTSRSDYQWSNSCRMALGRHGANPNVLPSIGSVPVTRLRRNGPRLLVEHISYEHEYNSRWDKNYPNRANRHGAYVLDEYHPIPIPSKYICTAEDAANITGLHSSPPGQGAPSRGVGGPLETSSKPEQHHVTFSEPVTVMSPC